MWSRKVIKERARATIKTNYWKMVLVALMMSLLATGASGSRGRDSFEDNHIDSDAVYDGGFPEYGGTHPSQSLLETVLGAWVVGVSVAVVMLVAVLGTLVKIFALNPLIVGGSRFFYQNIRRPASLGDLAYAFQNGYLGKVKTMFLKDLFTALWTLLFIVPGIVKAYEYRMIPYLLAEHPSMSAEEAFAVSKRMMDGNKMDAFVFDLSFFGWALLSGLTWGILGVFWVNPYIQQADAMLYDAIKCEHQQGGI